MDKKQTVIFLQMHIDSFIFKNILTVHVFKAWFHLGKMLTTVCMMRHFLVDIINEYLSAYVIISLLLNLPFELFSLKFRTLRIDKYELFFTNFRLNQEIFAIFVEWFTTFFIKVMPLNGLNSLAIIADVFQGIILVIFTTFISISKSFLLNNTV